MARQTVGVVVTVLILAAFSLSTASTVVTESYHAHTSIWHRFATTRLISVMTNKGVGNQEIAFGVALPRDAFIVNCVIETGGKTYKGQVRERTMITQGHGQPQGQAQGVTSPTGGNTDDLDAFQHMNKFEVSINVARGENVTFTVIYVQMLQRKNGRYELLTGLLPGQAVPDLVVEVFIRENTEITVLKAPALRQPGHTVSVGNEEKPNPLARLERPSSRSAHVIFVPSPSEQGTNGLHNTFVVQYDVGHSLEGEIVVRDGYFVHFFAPDRDGKSLPKNIVFVLDVSGSMMGGKLAQMKEAMLRILDDLQEDDHFTIVKFSTWATTWYNSVVAVNDDNIKEAKTWVKNFDIEGGTDIYDAIVTARQVFYDAADSSHGLNMIFFLTDGQDRADLLDDPSIAIYGLAFGDDADYEFMKALSGKNSGFAKKIYTDIDAAFQVANFYKEISSVALRDVKFNYDSETVEESTLTKTEFPVLFEGSEAVVTGKVKKDATYFAFEISSGGQNASTQLAEAVKDVHTLATDENFQLFTKSNYSEIGFSGLNNDDMGKIWGYVTIHEMLKDDQKRALSLDDLKNLDNILDLSLQFEFVTPLTSVIIRDPETGNQLRESVLQDDEEAAVDSRISKFIDQRPPTTPDPSTTTTTTSATTAPIAKSTTTDCPAGDRSCTASKNIEYATSFLFRMLKLFQEFGWFRNKQ